MSKHLARLRLPKQLGLRLFLLLTGAIVVITVATDAWRLQKERARVLTQLQREASLVAQAIEGQIVPLLLAGEELRLAELLEDVREAKDAKCAGVYSADGHRIQAVFEPDAASWTADVCPPRITAQRLAEAVSAHWSLTGTYNLQVPLTPDDRPRGILKLVFDASRISDPVQMFRNSILVERVLVFLAVVLTLWIGIALSVTRPIRRLMVGAEQIGAGNLDARIPVEGETEIGELARAFNRMAVGLAHSREEQRRADEGRAVMERQLRHAERLAAVGKLASVIAHEVGTPLHVIAGRARNLGKSLPEDDPRQEHVSTIREQVGHITRTMQHVLQSSRSIRARRENVDLVRLVREVARIVAPEYAARAVHLVLSLPSELPPIPADADGLTQVLLNLLNNALAATPGGGGVEVHGMADLRDGRPGIALSVSDTGVGIAPADLEHIFDPFFSTKRSGGTGLGLSICRDIVGAHAGSIAVESAPGAGARFDVWLPVHG